jgi:hypothetical protein
MIFLLFPHTYGMKKFFLTVVALLFVCAVAIAICSADKASVSRAFSPVRSRIRLQYEQADF